MKKEVVAEILKPHGFILDEERPIQYGVQLIFRNGAKVSVYDSFGEEAYRIDIGSPNNTPDDIRRPADGSPKPTV